MPRSPPPPSPPASIPLHAAREREALAAARDLPAFAAAGLPAPGAWWEAEAAVSVPPDELRAWLAGRVGGAGWPAWGDGGHGALRGETLLARARDAWWWPRFGVLAGPQGATFDAAAGEARSLSPDLSRLPGVAVDAHGGARFTPPADAPRREAAAVFAPFGAVGNYGHFLLDALPSLLALHEAGLTAAFPPVAPALPPWARDLLGLTFGAELAVEETRAPVVRVGDVVFTTLMDHHLHRPGPILLRLRDRIAARLPAPARRDRRVYLTRRRLPQRLMLEERALERALAARGFEVVEPEGLSAAAQAALMRECAVVVAPGGAALANALFLPEGARVFEILPSNFASHWVRDLARLAGLEWFGWSAPAPLPREAEPWRARAALLPRRLLRRYGYAWSLDVTAFLAFLDARM